MNLQTSAIFIFGGVQAEWLVVLAMLRVIGSTFCVEGKDQAAC